jgi:hypothetical protein
MICRRHFRDTRSTGGLRPQAEVCYWYCSQVRGTDQIYQEVFLTQLVGQRHWEATFVEGNRPTSRTSESLGQGLFFDVNCINVD